MAHVLAFGTFDGIHTGHLSFLAQAKRYGRVLTVVIARDETVKQLKQHAPCHGENERKKMVRQTKIADHVRLGDILLGRYTIIRQTRPNVIAIGYDQLALKKDIERFLREKKLDIDIVRCRKKK